MISQQTHLLEQKLVQLEADNIIYQDEIQRLRKRVLSLDEYCIKYELLLEQQKEESPLHRSRRVDEINNMNKKIDENNDKWNLKVKLLESKYEQAMHELQERNAQLAEQLDILNSSSPANNDKAKYGSSEINALREQINSLRSRNALLSQQVSAAKQNNQELASNLQQANFRQSSLIQHEQKVQQLLQQARFQQKQFYRQTIVDLEKQVEELNKEIQFHKERASPEREHEITRLLDQIKRIELQHNQQIKGFNQLIKNQTEQMKLLASTFEFSKSESQSRNDLLSQQLQQLRQNHLDSEQAHHAELMACRLEMQKLRQQEVNLLKQSFEKIQNSYDSERQQWQLILKQQQQELERIKQMWQDEKQKFNDQKNKLKSKINQLKARQKKSADNEKSLNDNQTYKLITSLREIDEEQNKYNDYESNVTFLSRQLKRATNKIQEKQRECAKLINQLKVQRDEFETETQFIKKVERQQTQFYKEKLMQADTQNTKLLQELRQKDKHIRTTHASNRLQHEKLLTENQQLNDILREMQRDYSRVTDNKKNLFQEYRSQRDMVFTGKVELNQERKDKLLQLGRQKNELEIAYKEREKQIRIKYELRINQLTEKLNTINQAKELASAENQILKERVNQDGDKFGKIQTEQNAKDLHKKLATLDLEISLTQNLFSTIKSVRNRSQRLKTKSELQQMSEHQSIESITSKEQKIRDLQNDSIDPEEFEKDNVAPTFSRPQQQQSPKRQESYENFSFKPHEPMIKITKVNKKNLTEVSFHNLEPNDGEKTAGWRGF